MRELDNFFIDLTASKRYRNLLPPQLGWMRDLLRWTWVDENLLSDEL